MALLNEKTASLDGASVVRVEIKPPGFEAYNSPHNMIRFIVTSEMLPSVPEGGLIPRMDIVANK